jgi:hypothetical protein
MVELPMGASIEKGAGAGIADTPSFPIPARNSERRNTIFCAPVTNTAMLDSPALIPAFETKAKSSKVLPVDSWIFSAYPCAEGASVAFFVASYVQTFVGAEQSSPPKTFTPWRDLFTTRRSAVNLPALAHAYTRRRGDVPAVAALSIA